MKSGVLFWGFKDLICVSEISKKMRHNLGIKDFYIQIQDSEKTVSLLELQPEEIIRNKYNLSNLQQWLQRNSKKDLFVLVDLFTVIGQEDFTENVLSLQKLLELQYKFYFISPKIIQPQSQNFFKNQENKTYLSKAEIFIKRVKELQEVIINSNACCQIALLPVQESIIINKEKHNLFEEKKFYCIRIFPRILENKNVFYITRSSYISKLIESFYKFVSSNSENDFSLLSQIEADANFSSKSGLKKPSNVFSPAIYLATDKFFDLKSSSFEYKYLMWCYIQSICEAQQMLESKNPENLFHTYFFRAE